MNKKRTMQSRRCVANSQFANLAEPAVELVVSLSCKARANTKLATSESQRLITFGISSTLTYGEAAAKIADRHGLGEVVLAKHNGSVECDPLGAISMAPNTVLEVYGADEWRHLHQFEHLATTGASPIESASPTQRAVVEEAAARDATEKAAAKRAVAERAAAHSTAQEKAAAQEKVAAAERAAQEKANAAEELKRHNPTRVATGIVCARCEHDKPGGCFSQRQHKKPREDRVCFGCTQVLWCSGCFGTRHREEFSQRQLRNGPGKQKCRKCMAILVDQEARELAWKEKKKRETAKLAEQCTAQEKRVGKDPAVYAPSVSSSNPWMPLSEASGKSAEASIYSDLLKRKQTPIAVLQGLIRGYSARLVVKQALDEQGQAVLLPRVLWLQRRRRQVMVDRCACAAARVELALRKQQQQILVAEGEEKKIEALREETERSLAAREEAEEEAEVATYEAEAQQHIADGEVECMAHIFLSGTCPCPKCEREREEEAKREAEEEAELEAEEEAERKRFDDACYDQDREVVVMIKPTFDSYGYEGSFEAGDKGTTFWMPDEEGYFRVENPMGDVGHIHKDDLYLVTEDESNEEDSDSEEESSDDPT